MIKEEKIQEQVKTALLRQEIYPLSVFFTYEVCNGLLAITVIDDFKELLEFLQYTDTCDKSGFEIFPESKTVVLTGMALAKLYINGV